ncbi:hypothetical protein MASR2M117_07530 [Paludibacter sp.]
MTVAALTAQERPNILWLTFEDTSSLEFGCYGNNQVSTPNIDSLAKNGIQYMNAWSVAPQSSPARSSLITGCYATYYGMDLHPVPQLTPENIFFPQLLRNIGYYCTNNDKTHYNTKIYHSSCWDENSKSASYNSQSRKPNQPFFAVFNTVTSHMGRVRTFHTDGRRDYSTEGIYADKLKLPPHVPDLPEIRSDYAGHLEASQDVDKWVGFFLKDLKDKKLDDNTIIFVFSDHGGCLPRGKGYLYETGLRVPLIVYFPEKWKHLANSASLGKNYELINFVDLAPTMLSLAGLKSPGHYQGVAKLGEYASKTKTEIQFGFGTNQLHHFMPVRAATDGKFKYMRNYTPYMQYAARNYYQWGMPSNMAWDKLILSGKNTHPEWNIPYQVQAPEMLFDLEKDPFELNNLASDKKYNSTLLKFRKAMSDHIRKTTDLGFFTPSFRENKLLFGLVHKEGYPINELLDLVEKASLPDAENIAVFKKYSKNNSESLRFWVAAGFANLAVNKMLDKAPIELINLLNDKDEYVKAEAGFACVFLGEVDKGMAALTDGKVITKASLSRLESISLHKSMRKHFNKELINKLKYMADTLPSVDNEDLGLIAKGVLVNLGELDIKELYGKDSYKKGLKLNQGRRSMLPLPNN